MGLQAGQTNSGSFKKGRKPWNKGLTKELDPRLDYERPTIFKNKTGQTSPNGRKQGYYRLKAFEYYGRLCQLCDKQARVVHHKDNNFKNNDIENLQPLCQSCHSKVHETWRNFK